MNARGFRTWTPIALAVALASTGLAAAADIDRTVPLEPGGSVSVEIPSGSLRVLGWDRAEVSVRGTYTGDPDRLRIEADADDVSIELEARHDDRARLDLEIRVPRLSELDVEALSCDLIVEGLEVGEVDVEIVDGDIRFGGTASTMDVESVAGDVVVTGTVGELDVESAAGGIRVDGAVRSLSIESAAGGVEVSGTAPFEEVSLSTVSGGVRFEGALAAEGELDVETLNGDTELWLDAGTAASVSVETFNGSLDVDWNGVVVGGKDAAADGAEHGGYHPGRTERFELGGGGGAEIRIETFNGNCKIRRR